MASNHIKTLPLRFNVPFSHVYCIECITAGIIFQMDTMLMLRTYLDKLTPSEFHTFLVGGHSTVAGFIFGLFVLFGVSVSYFKIAIHLLENRQVSVYSLAHNRSWFFMFWCSTYLQLWKTPILYL